MNLNWRRKRKKHQSPLDHVCYLNDAYRSATRDRALEEDHFQTTDTIGKSLSDVWMLKPCNILKTFFSEQQLILPERSRIESSKLRTLNLYLTRTIVYKNGNNIGLERLSVVFEMLQRRWSGWPIMSIELPLHRRNHKVPSAECYLADNLSNKRLHSQTSLSQSDYAISLIYSLS